jgi:NAD(P)-dependent dehydrogenase (short-subunit alcohol dehydrogenase family)
MKNASLIIGGHGGIAQAIIHTLLNTERDKAIVVVSRGQRPANAADIDWYQSDHGEASINEITQAFQEQGLVFDRVFICLGILHDDTVSPEKRLEDLNAESLLHVFNINSITPVLWLKHLLPVLKNTDPARVAVFSARVGSITDNHLGGWYGYRTSKAALNMLLKSTAIEYARRAPNVKIIAFHPGTMDTELSRPFSQNVPKDKLFSAAFVAKQVINILDAQTADGELSFVDWNHQPIDW